MSPGLLAGLGGPAGFPRVSGDEPQTTEQAFVKALFSPRERG